MAEADQILTNGEAGGPANGGARSGGNGRRGGKSAAAFRTISEVAEDLDVPPHVLRFWETKFAQVKPLKRGGGRRYYRPEDVALLQRIRELLYREGYTIKGVQKLLRDGAVRMPTAGEAARAAQAATPQKGGNRREHASEDPEAVLTTPDAPAGEATPVTTAASDLAEPVADFADATAIEGADLKGAVISALTELKELKRLLSEARR